MLVLLVCLLLFLLWFLNLDGPFYKISRFGYIELDTVGALSEAIQLSGTQFMGKTIVVQASQAEKNKTVTT